MEYSNKIKNEANKVFQRYMEINHNPKHLLTISIINKCIKNSIEEIESVRNRCKVHYQLVKENMKSTMQMATVCSTISHEIKDLTEQIKFLKSKLTK